MLQEVWYWWVSYLKALNECVPVWRAICTCCNAQLHAQQALIWHQGFEQAQIWYYLHLLLHSL